MSIHSRTSRTFTVSFPPDLAAQVEQLAKHESRTTSELFREAFRVYRAQQLRKTLIGFQETGGQQSPRSYTPEDLGRLAHKLRGEKARVAVGRRK